jgi:hypothetical protein
MSGKKSHDGAISHPTHPSSCNPGLQAGDCASPTVRIYHADKHPIQNAGLPVFFTGQPFRQTFDLEVNFFHPFARLVRPEKYD